MSLDTAVASDRLKLCCELGPSVFAVIGKSDFNYHHYQLRDEKYNRNKRTPQKCSPKSPMRRRRCIGSSNCISGREPECRRVDHITFPENLLLRCEPHSGWLPSAYEIAHG